MKIAMAVQIKDKRKRPWECSVICPKCKSPVEFLMRERSPIYIDIRPLLETDCEELKTKTSYNANFGKFRDGTDMVEYTNKIIEQRERK
jgi:hypothetical protein